MPTTRTAHSGANEQSTTDNMDPEAQSHIDEPDLLNPDHFSGEREKLWDFLDLCQLHFLWRPSRFTTDRHKIAFVVSHLRGAAFAWFRTLSRKGPHSPELVDFEKFTEALDLAYGDPEQAATADSQLRALRQTTSVNSYATQFKAIKERTYLENYGLCSQFLHGLKDEIKDELGPIGRSTELEDLIRRALQIDSRLYRRRLDKKTDPSPQSDRKPFPKRPFQRRSHPVSIPEAPSGYHLVPTDTARPRFQPLSDAEKQRRRAHNLCIYCASADHVIDDCPLRPKQRKPNSQHAFKPSGTQKLHHRSVAATTVKQPGIPKQGNVPAQNR